jgi:hypothetical protein
MCPIFDPPDENSWDRPPAKKVGLGVQFFPAIRLVQAWKQIAGPVLLQKSEFEGVVESGGSLALKIKIADSVWRNEFFYSRQDILKAYQAALRKFGVEENRIPKIIIIHSGSGGQTPVKGNYKTRKNPSSV